MNPVSILITLLTDLLQCYSLTYNSNYQIVTSDFPTNPLNSVFSALIHATCPDHLNAFFLSRSRNCERLHNVCPSVRMEQQLGSHRRDFHETCYLNIFFSKICRLKRITGTLHEDQYIFFNISRSILLRMKNVSDKICRESQNAHFMFNNFPPPPPLHPIRPENRAVYKIMWENILEPDRPQMTIWGKRIACWIPKDQGRIKLFGAPRQ